MNQFDSSPQKPYPSAGQTDQDVRGPLVYLELALPKDVTKFSGLGSASKPLSDISPTSSSQLAPHYPEEYPVVALPPPMKSDSEIFLSLQSWEGIVLNVEEDNFKARLLDRSGKGLDLEAEFIKDEVSSSDISLIEKGAVFYWDIGYIETKWGQRIRSSIITFRRLPAWTQKDISTAELKANKDIELLGWDQSSTTS